MQSQTHMLNYGTEIINPNQAHQNDDTIPEDSKNAKTLVHLQQDKFDAILQSPETNGYLEKLGQSSSQNKKTSIQSPNSRYLENRHLETEDRIWALRSQKLNNEIEIARLATLTPMELLKENNARRQTERFERGNFLTDPDEKDDSKSVKFRKTMKTNPISPDSVSRFSVRPTPVKSSRNKQEYSLRTSKSQKLHNQLEKNNETLMADKQKEIMKANGFSFKPTINASGTPSTRNQYYATRQGSTSSNNLIPATERAREDLVQWNRQIRERKSQIREQSRLSQSQSQLEMIQKTSRMCPGTIKILHAQGAIEKKRDELGQIVVVGSPEKAGSRLHQQAMQSIMNKHMKRMEVYLHRELLTEPPIAYPNRVTKTEMLISPKQQPLYNETFDSFKSVAEAAAKDFTSTQQIIQRKEQPKLATFQGSFGFNPHQGTYSTRNLNQNSKLYTSNSFSRQAQPQNNTRLSIQSQRKSDQEVQKKRDADLMRAKLNMYIKDKYSNQSVFKPSVNQESFNGDSRRNSDIGISRTRQDSVKQIYSQQESAMTDVAMLDKLTPCLKNLKSVTPNGMATSHFSPPSDGNKTTLKKNQRSSIGRDYDHIPSNAKVSFDFSNLEMPKQEALLSEEPVSPIINLRKTSMNSQQQQDQPLFFTQHTSRSANQLVTSSTIQQLEQLRFRIPPQSQVASSSSDSFNPAVMIGDKMCSDDQQADQHNNSLVMTAISQTSLPQNQR